MNRLYEIIYSLCEAKNISGGKMCADIGIRRSLLTDLKMGRKQSLSSETLFKIADYFGVTVDYLLTGEKKEKPTTNSDGLTAKDKKDIARDLERMLAEIENSETLMFDGNPATDGAKETLRNAIAMGLEYAKKVNKEKYTPKKYRHDKD